MANDLFDIPDWRLLRYFSVVAEEGSLRRAADRLYMTQPPLSRHMRHLEEMLGLTLFERHSRGLTLTEAGLEVLRIARPEEKEVAIAIPESRLAEIRAAKEIAVSLWAAPDTRLRGELRELAPAADPATRTYAARVRLLSPPPEVRLGMTARVQVGGGAANTLLVPLSAVLDTGQGPFVRIVQDGKVASRPVTVAHFREDGAALSAGLQGSEPVIVIGAARLVDGQAVQAKPATPPARQR